MVTIMGLRTKNFSQKIMFFFVPSSNIFFKREILLLQFAFLLLIPCCLFLSVIQMFLAPKFQRQEIWPGVKKKAGLFGIMYLMEKLLRFLGSYTCTILQLSEPQEKCVTRYIQPSHKNNASLLLLDYQKGEELARAGSCS